MRCLYCDFHLAPLRTLDDGGFCSDDHRFQYQCENSAADYLFLPKMPEPAIPRADTGTIAGPRSFPQRKERPKLSYEPIPWIPVDAGLVGATVYPQVQVPEALPAKLAFRRFSSDAKLPVARLDPHFGYSGSRWERPGTRYWKVAVPIIGLLLAAGLDRLLPGRFVSRAANLAVFSKPVDQIRRSIQDRAAIVLTEDFRNGLGNWENPAGFKRAGPVALYRPSLSLKDYSVEFVVPVDRQAPGFVFRAQDQSNYYAIRLANAKLVRYAVVKGREVERVIRSLPGQSANNSLDRIRFLVRDSDFTLIIQGQIADYWTDGRYRTGGVGFFSAKSESAKPRWLQVKYQDDFLGRFFALWTRPSDPLRNLDGNQ